MKNEFEKQPVGRKPQVPEHVIREHASRGLTRHEIADELGVTYRTVASMVHHYSIPCTPDHQLKYPPRWFAETIKILKEHGWSGEKIAGIFDVSPRTVRKYAQTPLAPNDGCGIIAPN